MEILNKFIHKYKLITNKIYKEKHRLTYFPRYTQTTSCLLGEELLVPDAGSFLAGYEEIFEKENYKFKSLNNSPKIIDCGANVGLSVIYFKQIYPNANIIAFEPDPKLFSILESNIKKMKLNQIELHQKAIWTSETELDFEQEGGFSGKIADSKNQISKNIKVKTARLADMLNQKIDFLKIDIEGAETVVLLDLDQKLSNVDKLFIEYHSQAQEPQTLQIILELLSKNEFRYHIKEAYTEKYPFINNRKSGFDLQLEIFAFKI